MGVKMLSILFSWEKLKDFLERGDVFTVTTIMFLLSCLFIFPIVGKDMKICDIKGNKKVKIVVVIYSIIFTLYILSRFLYYMKHPDEAVNSSYWYIY